MIEIIYTLFFALPLLIGAAVIYYRFSDKIIYLFLLILGLFAVNLSVQNDSLYIIISVIIIGAVSGFTFRHLRSFQFFILVSALSLASISTANYYYLHEIKGIDLLSGSRIKFIELLNENPNIMESDKKDFTARIDESLDIIKEVIPFAYFLNSFIFSLLGFSIARYFFTGIYFRRAAHKPDKPLEGVEFFRIQDQFIFFLIASWLTVLLADKDEYYIIYNIGLNAALIFSVIYLIQSIGIIKFFLIKKSLPVLIIPVFLITIWFLGIEYFFFVLIILASMGALDFWADFRKIRVIDDIKKI